MVVCWANQVQQLLVQFPSSRMFSEGVPSRKLTYPNFSKNKNHFQMCFGKGYLSSQEGPDINQQVAFALSIFWWNHFHWSPCKVVLLKGSASSTCIFYHEGAGLEICVPGFTLEVVDTICINMQYIVYMKYNISFGNIYIYSYIYVKYVCT